LGNVLEITMNERIKELAEQAGILKEQSVQAKIVKNEDGTWTSILEYPDLEKFAELLIQKCADIGERYADGNYEVRNQILEHFGVEE
jgi:hypothetical protein